MRIQWDTGVCGDSVGQVCADSVGQVCGDSVGPVCGDSVGNWGFMEITIGLGIK